MVDQGVCRSEDELCITVGGNRGLLLQGRPDSGMNKRKQDKSSVTEGASENSGRSPHPRSAIYLLPNLFTTGAMFAGFYAIISAINDRPVAACIAVFIASLLDSFDGRVARMTNTQSDFGVQYDSLSDLVSFGLAPSVIAYTWALSSMADMGNLLGKVGWLAAFLFAACAALRLARFNTQAGKVDKSYFVGLSSPAAGGMIITFVWCAEEFGFSGPELNILMLLITIAAGLMMVSNIKYFSFKRWPEMVPFFWILFIVVGFVLMALAPEKLLFVIAYGYALSGPVIWARNRLKRRARRAEHD